MNINYIHYNESTQLGKYVTEGNFIAYSELTAFHAPMVPRDVVGLKYVLQGEENYVVNGHLKKVKPGELLVVDELLHGEAFSGKSAKSTAGLCINIERSVIQEVINDRFAAEDDQLDNNQHNFQYDLSIEPLNANLLQSGKAIQQLLSQVASGPTTLRHFSKDFFYLLAQQLVNDHCELSCKTNRILASKKSTRQELYKRLNNSKLLMEEEIDKELNINKLAQAAGMSEFYFSRSFKQLFGCSPYQYLLQQRLLLAKKQLENGSSVSETAFVSGFADIYSFSKAFKKQFGLSPSFLSKI